MPRTLHEVLVGSCRVNQEAYCLMDLQVLVILGCLCRSSSMKKTMTTFGAKTFDKVTQSSTSAQDALIPIQGIVNFTKINLSR